MKFIISACSWYIEKFYKEKLIRNVPFNILCFTLVNKVNTLYYMYILHLFIMTFIDTNDCLVKRREFNRIKTATKTFEISQDEIEID